MSEIDTIAAVSSPRGNGLRGIVRLSGPGSIPAVESYFRPYGGEPGLDDMKWGRTRGRFSMGRSGVRAPVDVWVMRRPRSYTGEDQVELHFPGSVALLDIVVDLLRRVGARPAEPGEFTRRAFMNGRMDLSQAEAVSAVIHARNEAERLAARTVLDGTVRDAVEVVAGQILELLAPVELAIDFSDQDIEIIETENLADTLRGIAAEIDGLGEARRGRARSESGVRILLRGPTNAGKSSLFNSVVGEDRAIVSDQRGTTRDFVEGAIEREGVRLVFVDTAGEDIVGDDADQEAHRLREEQEGRADLVVDVSDGHREVSDALAGADLHVFTHSDLVPESNRTVGERVRWVSNVTLEGIELVIGTLLELATGDAVDAESTVLHLNQRHIDALERVSTGLRRAADSVQGDDGHELVAADIREALGALREITGEDYDQELLDRVMRDFCIGK